MPQKQPSEEQKVQNAEKKIKEILWKYCNNLKLLTETRNKYRIIKNCSLKKYNNEYRKNIYNKKNMNNYIQKSN